ncbi:MAG: C-GCAxxG-C-C family protein [Oscillospiraceae bacterium]|jgi:C_GCAxxG_C_C family probable redox protein|nr:C-GCAxxG-C-C family protein [Oscillospiraceae bacterium]
MGADKKETAAQRFRGGFNCAQAVFSVFADECGLETDDALRIAGGLGGGLGCGEVCGALSGGVLAVGARFGQCIEGDSGAKMNCAAKTRELTRAFRLASGGALRCSGILGYDLSTDEGRARRASDGTRESVCIPLVEAVIDGVLAAWPGEARD